MCVYESERVLLCRNLFLWELEWILQVSGDNGKVWGGYGGRARSVALEQFIDEWRKVKTRRCLRRAFRRYAEEQRIQRTFAHWLRRTFDSDRC